MLAQQSSLEFSNGACSNLEFSSSTDLENDVKLPYIIKDRILMSPGVWNGMYYDRISLDKAYQSTNWDSKDVRALFADHKDLNSTEWIGEIRNPHMVNDDLLGDLYIVDKQTAMNLAYGAKMGISPKVVGKDTHGKMTQFTYANFSVVVKPAVKTAYINNQEGCVMTKEDNIVKDDASADMPANDTDKEKKKYPEPAANMSALDKELSAYTDFIKDYMGKHAGSSIKDASTAWEKRKMSETIEMSDVMQVLKDITSALGEIKSALASKDEKYPPMDKKNECSEKPAVIENKDKEVIAEMSEKIIKLEKQLNVPEKVAMKTAELSYEAQDIDSQILAHLQSM